MSETMSKKDQKAIQEAEKIIAKAKQNGLKDSALIVLYATDKDGDISLDRAVEGMALHALAALCSALIEVCKTSRVPLTRVVSSLLEDC